MMQTRNYFTLPPIVTGYPIDDRISVVVPVARTNLVINPSFETNTTSWTAIGGSIARSTAQQYHGAYGLAVTPTAATTDGARYDTVSLVSGTVYAYSCKILGIAGKSYKIALETTGSVELASITFVASGRWQWVYGYYTESSTTTRRLTLRKAGGTETSIFYIDGAQVEAIAAGETVSTYLDGSQQGLVPNQLPVPYYWTGTPHASTSVRSGLTRAGGMVVPFKYFGFFLTALIGLGLAPPQNVATEYARIDGGYDDYTRKPTRQFTVQGNFESRADYLSLRQQRGGLSRLLDRDLVGIDQRLILLRDVSDECGITQTSTCRLIGKYQGGLDGQTDNHIASVAPITFTQYLGVVLADQEIGASLNVQTAITDGLHILERSAAGVWHNLSTGANANVWSLFYASDGKLYAGGEFTSIGGVAAKSIAYWDGTAWNAMGTGMPGAGKAVYRIVEGPDGSIYACGDGTSFGGVANTGGLGKWNGSAWSSITTTAAANGDVMTLAYGPDGVLYAGGAFTTINGVAAARVAQRSAAGTWTAMAGGSATTVLGMGLFGSRLYIGGDTNASGNYNVSYWTGTAWSSLGQNAGALPINDVEIAPNGVVYASGDIVTMGGISAEAIARLIGVQWSALGTSINNTAGTTNGYIMQLLPDGTLLVGGVFNQAGSIDTVDNIARWNGSAWVFVDVDIAWSTVRAIARSTSGAIAIGGTGATSTGVAAAQTTITNPGTARSYPTIVIKGPSSGLSRIYQIENITTGRTIYLDYEIQSGETATLMFQPDNLSFISTFQNNIASTILPGSNTAEFFLQPGANTISFFSADSTVTAVMYFRPAYVSLDDVP